MINEADSYLSYIVFHIVLYCLIISVIIKILLTIISVKVKLIDMMMSCVFAWIIDAAVVYGKVYLKQYVSLVYDPYLNWRGIIYATTLVFLAIGFARLRRSFLADSKS